MYVDLSTKLFTINANCYRTLYTYSTSWLSNKVIKELKNSNIKKNMHMGLQACA
jgi:hypothetical protein